MRLTYETFTHLTWHKMLGSCVDVNLGMTNGKNYPRLLDTRLFQAPGSWGQAKKKGER